MSKPNWDEAQEGYPVWVESKVAGLRDGWHREKEDRFEDSEGRFWRKGGEGLHFIVHHRPAAPEWNGEGNPPVGIECELMVAAVPTLKYSRVKVLAHDEDRVVFRVLEGGFKGQYDSDLQRQIQGHPVFRPLLTAEQMAEKQREEKINKIMADAGMWDSAYEDDPEARLWATALVDKGYEPPGEITK